MDQKQQKNCRKCGEPMIPFKTYTHGHRRNGWYCPRCRKENLDESAYKNVDQPEEKE